MDKKSIVKLVGIYIILLGLSYAFYIVLVAVKANDSIASSLLSWTATMFATIALLYTFYSWRNQKETEVIATEAKNLSLNIIAFKQNYIKVYNYFTFTDDDNFCKGKAELKKLKIEAFSIRNQIIYFCILSSTKEDLSIKILDEIILYMDDKSQQSNWIDRVDNDYHKSFDETSKNIQDIIISLSYYSLYKFNISKFKNINTEIKKLFPKL